MLAVYRPVSQETKEYNLLINPSSAVQHCKTFDLNKLEIVRSSDKLDQCTVEWIRRESLVRIVLHQTGNRSRSVRENGVQGKTV